MNYNQIKNQIYIEPVLLEENKKPIQEQMHLGEEIRASNMEKDLYKNNIPNLEKLFNKDGRLTFDFGKQELVEKQISDLEKDYGLKLGTQPYKYTKKELGSGKQIEVELERPTVLVGKKHEHLEKILKTYTKAISKGKLEDLTEKNAKKVIDFLKETRIDFNDQDFSKKLSGLKQDLFKNKKEEYKETLKLLQTFLRNEVSYQSIITEIENYGVRNGNLECLQHSVGDIVNKFENIITKTEERLTRSRDIEKEGDQEEKKNFSYSQLVFSINPYDVAMMSTQKKQSEDQGWESCMGIYKEDNSLGMNFHKISDEIGAFSIIVYVTNNGDLENPISRVLLKPYIAEKTNSIVWKGQRVYGKEDLSMIEQISDIVNLEININAAEDIYQLDETIYADGYSGLNFDLASRNDIIKYKDDMTKETDWMTILKRFPEDVELQQIAVEKDRLTIRYIKNPSEDIQLLALEKSFQSVEILDILQSKKIKMSKKVLSKAFKNTHHAINYIKNPSEDQKLEAVQGQGLSLQHIKDPSLLLIEEAIKSNSRAIEFVNNPSEDLKILTINNTEKWDIINILEMIIAKTIEKPSNDIFLLAFKKNPNVIQYIEQEDQTEEMKLNAVKRDGLTIDFISEPSEKIKEEAVLQNHNALKKIENPSMDLKCKAIESHDGSYLKYFLEKSFDFKNEAEVIPVKTLELIIEKARDDEIKDIIEIFLNSTNKLSESQIIKAIDKDGKVIEFLENSSEEVQIKAIQNEVKKGDVITIVDSILKKEKNLSEEVQLVAIQKMNNESTSRVVSAIDNSQNGLSELAQLAAVEKFTWSIRYIKKPLLITQLKSIEHRINSDVLLKHLVENNNSISESVQIAIFERLFDRDVVRTVKYIFENGNSISLLAQKEALNRAGDQDYKKHKKDLIEYLIEKNIASEDTLLEAVEISYKDQSSLYEGLIKTKNRFSENVQIAFIEKSDKNEIRKLLKHLKNPSVKTQISLIQNNKLSNWDLKDYILEYGNIESEDVQSALIKNSPSFFINYIENPSEVIQLLAIQSVERDYLVEGIVKSINEKGGVLSEKAKLSSIERNPIAIKYIEKPSEELQLKAVEKTDSSYIGLTIEGIKDPTEKTQIKAIKRTNDTGEICRILYHISKNKNTLFEKVQFELVGSVNDEYGLNRVLEIIKGKNLILSEKAQIKSVEMFSSIIGVIKDPTEKTQILSVEDDPYNIQRIENPTKKVQLIVQKKNPSLFNSIKNPEEEVVKKQIRKNLARLQFKQAVNNIQGLSKFKKEENVNE